MNALLNLRITVAADLNVDCAYLHQDDRDELFLRPQPFQQAVRHARRVLENTGLSPEEIERLVREQCPELVG